MEQLNITYFFPLTEQIQLDLDYTPCKKYEEEKLKDSQYVGNRIDQWGINSIHAGTMLVSNGYDQVWSTTINEPKLIIYPDKTPITFKTENKPNILTRLVYRALGVKWEKA